MQLPLVDGFLGCPLYFLCLTVTRRLDGFSKSQKALDGIVGHFSLEFSILRLEIQTPLFIWPRGAQVSLDVPSGEGAQVLGLGALLPASPPLPPPSVPFSSVNTIQICGQINPGEGMNRDLTDVRNGRGKVPGVYPITWSELKCQV